MYSKNRGITCYLASLAKLLGQLCSYNTKKDALFSYKKYFIEWKKTLKENKQIKFSIPAIEWYQLRADEARGEEGDEGGSTLLDHQSQFGDLSKTFTWQRHEESGVGTLEWLGEEGGD